MLSGFPMHGMLFVPRAVFFHFQTPCGVLFVLARAVVASLAFSAGQDDVYSHGVTQ
jgi:hypothetical protein